jgi:signal transduction histidine kinase
VSIVRFDADGTATECTRRSERGEVSAPGTRWSLDGNDISALVRASGRPARISGHTGRDGEVAETSPRAGVGSSVAVPIVVAGGLWGAIVASSPSVEPLPVETESRLADFCELVGVALSNANARAEVERLADEQAALRRVAMLVAHEFRPEEAFAKVAEEVGRLLGVEVAVIQRYDSDGYATVVGSWDQLRTEAFGVGYRWKPDPAGITAVVRRTNRPARVDIGERSSGSIAADARDAGVRSAVASPIVTNGRLWGAITAGTTRAEPMPADAESRIEHFTELVATALSNVQARAEAQRLANEQAALRRVATLVAREASPEEVFLKVAEEVGPLLGAESGSIDRFEPGGYCTVVGSWGKLREAFEVGSRWKLEGGSATVLVYRTGQPVRLDSYEHGSGLIAAQARGMGLRSAVGSPIVVNGRLWGALVGATSRAEPLLAEAESRIAQFADLVATAIANVQARSDLAASRARIVAAADEERRRVVRDLHDGAQQRLVHTVVALKLARRAQEQGGADAAALLVEALEHAQAATDELRELAHGILPSALTSGGLGAGVRELASRMSIPVDIDVNMDRLPAAVEATTYFIVAEALTNVTKHSRAHRATVSTHLVNRMLEVEVTDDGVGGAQVHGTGLVGLRDRVGVFGGSLRVQSPAGDGTVIAASIPLATPPDA